MQSNILAPQTLFLKVGAQVILLANIDDSLCNGRRGRVVDFVAVDENERQRRITNGVKRQRMSRYWEADRQTEEAVAGVSGTFTMYIY